MRDPRGQRMRERGHDPHTVFARILAGELPAAFVYRDELVSAFMDIQPITPGHTLVVPNRAVASLADLAPETAARLFCVGQRVAAAIRATDLACEGINLFMADGAAAGQTVFHLHLHVFPRYAGDGFAWKLPASYGTPPSREAIASAGEKIRRALERG